MKHCCCELMEMNKKKEYPWHGFPKKSEQNQSKLTESKQTKSFFEQHFSLHFDFDWKLSFCYHFNIILMLFDCIWHGLNISDQKLDKVILT